VFFSFKNLRPRFLDWIASNNQAKFPALLALGSLFASFFIFYLSPQTGINIVFFDENQKIVHQQRLNIDSFNIIPPFFPERILLSDHLSCRVSTCFYSKKPIHLMQFFVSGGNATWKLDDRETATVHYEDSQRHLVMFSEISPGVHRIECEINRMSSIPRISIDASLGVKKVHQPLKGPFILSNQPFAFSFLHISRQLSAFFILIGLFLLIPFFNTILSLLSQAVYRYSALFLPVGVIAILIFSFYLHIQFIQVSQNGFEADEAAFGVMSQRLLQGQSPPLFHYGQNYQGTLEAIPLSFSLSHVEEPNRALHRISQCFGFLFILITVCTLGIFGNASLALFSLVCLGIGGLHFHWIVSKAWFGYSFSLFLGAALWAVVLYGAKKGRFSPGLLLLWSFIAGMALYELPISILFILGSGFVFIYSLKKPSLNFSKQDNKNRNLSSFLVSGSLKKSHLFFLVICLFLFLSPYWISPLLSGGFDAAEFLFQGRNLPSTRIMGENAFFDRFLCECLPTLLGSRAPYDQQHDLPSVFFPSIPSLFFALSVLLFPLFSRLFLPSNTLIHSRLIRYSILFYTILSIVVLSFSSFGLWPWYAIPLYWVIPILYFVFLRLLWSLSPSICFMAGFLLLLSTLSAFPSHSFLFHQPSSLSYQGLPLPTNFSELKQTLKEQNVRFLICDQGFDFFEKSTGRDWIGESLFFDSSGEIVSVDRLSRRFPDSAQELLNASRVGYLFHKRFFVKIASNLKAPESAPLTIENVSNLFGPKFLDFSRFDIDPYILFLPPQKFLGSRKNEINLKTSDPIYDIYLHTAIDNNISARGSGRETYWSSGPIGGKGMEFFISYPKPHEIKKIILFHGTKISDRTRENAVWYNDSSGENVFLGSFVYHHEARSSLLLLEKPVVTDKISITIPQNKDYWWTIFELWIN